MNRRTPAIALHLHPSAAPREARALTATVEATDAGGLRLDYRLRAHPAGLRVPSPGPGGRRDLLWQHTCFEAFVAVEGEDAYREFNFSPSGAWALYAFERYRTPADPVAPASGDPAIACGWVRGEFCLTAWIGAADLPARRDGAGLAIGLCAVVEDADGSLWYWAVRHHPDKPDFHDRDGRAVRLPAEMLRPAALREATP